MFSKSIVVASAFAALATAQSSSTSGASSTVSQSMPAEATAGFSPATVSSTDACKSCLSRRAGTDNWFEGPQSTGVMLNWTAAHRSAVALLRPTHVIRYACLSPPLPGPLLMQRRLLSHTNASAWTAPPRTSVLTNRHSHSSSARPLTPNVSPTTPTTLWPSRVAPITSSAVHLTPPRTCLLPRPAAGAAALLPLPPVLVHPLLPLPRPQVAPGPRPPVVPAPLLPVLLKPLLLLWSIRSQLAPSLFCSWLPSSFCCKERGQKLWITSRPVYDHNIGQQQFSETREAIERIPPLRTEQARTRRACVCELDNDALVRLVCLVWRILRFMLERSVRRWMSASRAFPVL